MDSNSAICPHDTCPHHCERCIEIEHNSRLVAEAREREYALHYADLAVRLDAEIDRLMKAEGR